MTGPQSASQLARVQQWGRTRHLPRQRPQRDPAVLIVGWTVVTVLLAAVSPVAGSLPLLAWLAAWAFAWCWSSFTVHHHDQAHQLTNRRNR